MTAPLAPHAPRRSLPWLAAALLLGCQGTLEGGSPAGGSTGSGATPDGPSTGTHPGPGAGDREPTPAPSRGTLGLRVTAETSSTVTLAWDAVAGASGYDLFLGSEPPLADGEPLPVEQPIGTVAGGDTSFVIEGLGASLDVFVRVEARDAAERAWGVTHARTEGALDGALRAVHGYGPRTLMLVLADPAARYEGGVMTGSEGAAWAGGTWSVERSDGTPIAVTRVHRETIPGGQPDYPVGFDRYGDGSIVDLIHHVFLLLDAPLGSRDVLRVRHDGTAATSLDVRVPYSDRYTTTPLLQVNQVGYSPRASRRWAYVSGWMGNGGAAELSGLPAEADVLIEPVDPLSARLTAVGSLAVELRAAADREAGAEVRQIDLAAVPPMEGRRYRVRLPGVGVSWPTAVSEESTFRAFYATARGLFHNRWCGDLNGDVTEWSRPEDHCRAYFVTGRGYDAYMFSADTPRIDERPVRGGHHDAGDFDIRPFHVVAGQYLLRAFEMAPERFTDGQLTLPESGNGIPDLLDEALWSLRAWQDLQNPDGSVRAGVESHRHPAGIYKAHDDQLPYWTWDPVPWHTAFVAALFAQAARLVQPYDAARAAELEAGARTAFDSRVAASSPAAYRMYAAGELLALTGERRYAIEFETRWAELDRWGRGAFDTMQSMTMLYPGSFHSGFAMADYVMGYAQSDGARPDIVAVIRRELLSNADGAAAALLESPHAHRNGRSPTDNPDWGHAVTTGRHADYLYQALELGGLDEARRQRYFDAISVAADYALGCNPLGMVYLTGLGSRSPRQPLHLDSLAFLAEGMPPVPGIPVYGLVNRLPSVYYYEPVAASFEPSFDSLPPGRRYADSRTSVTTSEFTVWESQAPFAELFSALVAARMEPPTTWLPSGGAHQATLPEHYVD